MEASKRKPKRSLMISKRDNPDQEKPGELKEIKSELAQFIKLATETDTKLETMVEAKLPETKKTVSQQVDNKVRDMKDDISESLEIEKRKKKIFFMK